MRFAVSAATTFSKGNASQQVGDDVVITFNGNNTITLWDVQLANLHADDFAFV